MRYLIFRFAAWAGGFTFGLIAVAALGPLSNKYYLDSDLKIPVLTQGEFSPPAGWGLVSACGVAFYVPPGVSEQKARGIDSCVGHYRNENLLIHVDEMFYILSEDDSRKSEYSHEQAFHLEKTQIDGRKAEVITCFETNTIADREGLNYVAVLYVPRMMRDGGNLTIWTYSRTLSEQAQALELFKSLQFFRSLGAYPVRAGR